MSLKKLPRNSLFVLSYINISGLYHTKYYEKSSRIKSIEIVYVDISGNLFSRCGKYFDLYYGIPKSCSIYAILLYKYI